jgi:predicted nucleic acid-binding protein
MKKQRIYFDTSVFGGYFDKEFEEFTKPLFDRINNGEFTVPLSTMLDEELEFAPERIKNLISNLDDGFTEFLEDKDEAVDLATEYITEKVVGVTSYADCLHIALATIYQADLLVSWNFKHVVNVDTIQ